MNPLTQIALQIEDRVWEETKALQAEIDKFEIALAEGESVFSDYLHAIGTLDDEEVDVIVIGHRYIGKVTLGYIPSTDEMCWFYWDELVWKYDEWKSRNCCEEER
jgi:hypothetical protein